MAETEEAKLSNQIAEEAKGEVSVASSDSTNPEGLLKQAQAQDELTRLQLRQVADLIPAFRIMFQEQLREVDKRIQALNQILSQAQKLHAIMIQDAEAELEILKTFQSEIVVLDKVESAGTLAAAQPNPPKKGRS